MILSDMMSFQYLQLLDYLQCKVFSDQGTQPSSSFESPISEPQLSHNAQSFYYRQTMGRRRTETPHQFPICGRIMRTAAEWVYFIADLVFCLRIKPRDTAENDKNSNFFYNAMQSTEERSGGGGIRLEREERRERLQCVDKASLPYQTWQFP